MVTETISFSVGQASSPCQTSPSHAFPLSREGPPDGPGENNHLSAGGAAQPAEATSMLGFMAATEPRMPSLRMMHKIVAADPCAQALSFERLQ